MGSRTRRIQRRRGAARKQSAGRPSAGEAASAVTARRSRSASRSAIGDDAALQPLLPLVRESLLPPLRARPETVAAGCASWRRRGAVVYVMRYSSRLDYLLFNTLFAARGAAALELRQRHPLLLLPARSSRSCALPSRRKRGRSRASRARRGPARYVRSSGAGSRSSSSCGPSGSFAPSGAGCGACGSRQDELDLLEVVRESCGMTAERRGLRRAAGSIFWRKGPRSESRFLNLDYGALAALGHSPRSARSSPPIAACR